MLVIKIIVLRELHDCTAMLKDISICLAQYLYSVEWSWIHCNIKNNFSCVTYTLFEGLITYKMCEYFGSCVVFFQAPKGVRKDRGSIGHITC